MRTEITKLHKRLGVTFVYVTHDQVEAMTMGDKIVVMKDGVIQQVDVPQKIYDKPCNVFVASFIGSPRMNIIEGVLRKDIGRYSFECDEMKVGIPEERFDRTLISKNAGKEVLLGIRPESIMVQTRDGLQNYSEVSCVVDMTELLGAEKYLYAFCGSNKIIAKIPGHTIVNENGAIPLYIDKNTVHLFDKESQQSLILE